MSVSYPRRLRPPTPAPVVKPAPPPPPSDGSFCSVAPGADVWIYHFQKEFEIVYWLCRRHCAARVAAGEKRSGRRAPPHDGLECFDCHFEAIG